MIFIPIADLKSIDDLLEKIEESDVCIITKEGNPVAEILAVKQKKEGWKRKVNRVKVTEGISTTEIIRHERDS